jgi:hypothetical protein
MDAFYMSEFIKIMLFFVVFTCSMANGAWKQNEFVIGSFVGPEFLGVGNEAKDRISVTKYKKAKFNLFIYSKNMELRNQNIYNNVTPYYDTTAGNATVSYRLSILNGVGGVKMFTGDHEHHATLFNDFLCAASKNIYQKRVSDMVTRYKNDTNYSELYGYIHGDEPGPGIAFATCPQYMPPPGVTNYTLDLITRMIEVQTVKDPDKLAYTNLRPYFGFKSWNDTGDLLSYDKYVSDFIANSSVKVVSFDYYLFESKSPKGYFRMNNPDGSDRSHYFRHMELFANKIKAQLNIGNYKQFWGMPCATEHIISDGRHYIYTELIHLRFYAYSNILYGGAKGIIWYNYALNANSVSETYIKAPENDTSLLTSVTVVNGELCNIGSIMMNLKWVKTIHGSAIDPSSGEINLKTYIKNKTLPFYGTKFEAFRKGSSSGNTWSSDSLAVGLFKDNQFDYLLILNKSLYMKTDKKWAGFTNNTNYTVFGKVYPRVFDKTNSGWKLLPQVYNNANNTTSFELIIHPGNMELVWLDPSDN